MWLYNIDIVRKKIEIYQDRKYKLYKVMQNTDAQDIFLRSKI